MITDAQLTATRIVFERIAKECVEVEQVCATVYGFASELACLRLFREYNRMERVLSTNMGYSENMQSWYFCIETQD